MLFERGRRPREFAALAVGATPPRRRAEAATGITVYLQNGGSLEYAQKSRPTKPVFFVGGAEQWIATLYFATARRRGGQGGAPFQQAR